MNKSTKYRKKCIYSIKKADNISCYSHWNKARSFRGTLCLSSASYEESIFLFQFFVKTTDLFRSSLASTIHATSESQVIGLSFKIEPEVKVGLDLPCELSFYTLNARFLTDKIS
jgi:hypothetical protein